jgi:ribosome-associated toxin RatA of RatAB toxin-antitoxin module|tara:strand:+ start:1316 stop:1702 length:387 start_codon:yes stop_codon:yes gene_type:complete
MYSLVNDIEAYPDFLPWCTDANIISSDEATLTASISISAGKIKKIFTTLNTMKEGISINMTLIKGPFKELNGQWIFQDNSEGGSTVSLEMQFEFKNKLLKYTFGIAFEKIIDSLVDVFIERANVIYGE